MNEVEKQELKSRVEGMSQEETLIAVKVIPTDVLWDELRRRETAERNQLQGVKDLVSICI